MFASQMKSYFQQYVQSQNLQLSSTLPSFGFRPHFFNIFFGVSDMNNHEHNDIPREKPQTPVAQAMLLFNEVKPASRWLVVFLTVL